MQLVEQHIIKSNNPFFKECDSLCFKSKNLYNACLYKIRQELIHNNNNISYDLHPLMKNTEEYKLLPAKVSSAVLLTVQNNFKAYFKGLASFNKNPKKFKGKPKLPYYLHKTDGRFVVSYTNQAISRKIFKITGKIKLSKTNIEFKTRIVDFSMINCVRIVPKLGYYVIELVYTIPDTELKQNNNRYAAIDLGINNLATLTSNVKGIQPIIINGKPLKSINQYYNKKNAELSSVLEVRNGKKKSKKLQKLTMKRKFKIENYLHKSSKLIVEELKNNNINTLIIGKNDGWKQEVELGKKNNQNFVNIPHSRFIEMLNYKCEREGIRMIEQEESYTSQASFINLDRIPKYEQGKENTYEFSGYRDKNRSYKIKKSRVCIHGDVNGSYNILRKAVPDAFSEGIEGVGVHPRIITILKK